MTIILHKNLNEHNVTKMHEVTILAFKFYKEADIAAIGLYNIFTHVSKYR